MCCIVKYGLFLTNFIFTIAGLTILGLGIAVLLQLGDVFEIVDTNVDAIPIAIIVLGAVTFVIAFFGCCGAIRENRCLLVLYGICMIVLAAGKVYISVILFRNLNTIKQTVQGWLNSAFVRPNVQDYFNAVEITFTCCGTTGAGAYTAQMQSIPSSCCPSNLTCNLGNSYSGCNEVVGDFFEKYSEIISIVIVIIIAIEVLAMIFSFAFCCNVRNKRNQTV